MTPAKMPAAGLMILVGALMAPGRAAAQAAPPPAADAKILVLGFEEHNKRDPVRRKEVADSIINDGLGIALQPSLRDADLACLKASCLENLAKQWNEADYIVGGAIFEIPQDKTQYEIQAWLYRVNTTEDEQKNKVQRLFTRRENCKAADYPGCLATAVGTLVRALPEEQRRPRPPIEYVTPVRPLCSRWNFARAATLGASVGLLGSGLIAGTSVAAYRGRAKDGSKDGSFTAFTGQKYSAVGFGAAALALIPAGLALGRPSLFLRGGGADAGVDCIVPPQSRWTAARGAAVGVFSGLLVSGLVALVGVAANQNSHCLADTKICDLTPAIALGGALSATWVLGLNLSLAIPGRAGSP